MPGRGVFHTLRLWFAGSGMRPARFTGLTCTDPGAPWPPRRVPARVLACLIPGHLRVVEIGGDRMNDCLYWEVPLERVPFACRLPNTPLWITRHDNTVVAVEPRDL